MTFKTKLRGFTLIELLAVIAIIGILAAIALVGISGATKRARDAQRKRDVDNLKTALELYNQDEGKYPDELDVLRTTNYIKTIPTPPKQGPTAPTDATKYEYTPDSTNDNYLLRVGLEYTGDKITAPLTPTVVTCSSGVTVKGNGVTASSVSSNGVTTAKDRCFRVTND